MYFGRLSVWRIRWIDRDGDNMDERDDINKYREREKRKKFAAKSAVFMVVITVVILVAANWQTLVGPLKNVALNIGAEGFPITLPGSTKYDLGEMGDNLYLLTDTYLYTYTAAGGEIMSVQHGFQNPACSGNSTRALVYDRNGRTFKFFSKSKEIYSIDTDDNIIFAGVGNNERTAVITSSTRYSNLMYIFNSEGRQIFRWASPDEKIMGVCFGSDDNCIFVSVVGEKNGTLNSSVLRFDFNNAESETWRSPVGDDITYSLQNCFDGIYAVTESGSYLFDEKTGEIKASNSFNNELLGIPKSDTGIRTIIFRDSASNGAIAVSYNGKLEAVASVKLGNVSAFDTNGGKLYVLSENHLNVYNSNLEGIKKYDLDDEYSDVKILGNSAYLLRYNTVQRQVL